LSTPLNRVARAAAPMIARVRVPSRRSVPTTGGLSRFPRALGDRTETTAKVTSCSRAYGQFHWPSHSHAALNQRSARRWCYPPLNIRTRPESVTGVTSRTRPASSCAPSSEKKVSERPPLRRIPTRRGTRSRPIATASMDPRYCPLESYARFLQRSRVCHASMLRKSTPGAPTMPQRNSRGDPVELGGQRSSPNQPRTLSTYGRSPCRRSRPHVRASDPASGLGGTQVRRPFAGAGSRPRVLR
jgi:hypothetical protein